MTWIEPGPEPEQHRVRVAELGRSGWSPPQTVASGPDLIANWADFPQLARTRAGALTVSYGRRVGAAKYAYAVELATSSSRGMTDWQTLGFAHRDGTETEHGFVSMVPEGDGVRLFWLDGRAMAEEPKGPMSLRTAVVAGEIRQSEILDSRTCECCQTSATMTDRGPIVVFRDRSTAEIRDVAIVRREAGAWTTPQIVHADGWEFPGCPVNGPAIDARGRDVVVGWYTGKNDGAVSVAFSSDSGKTFSAPLVLDAASPLGRVDVVMLDDGRTAVSWLASAATGAGSEVRVATVASAGTAHSKAAVLGVRTVAITSAERRIGFPRLARSGERLVIAWVDGNEPGRLRMERFDVPRGGLPEPAPVTKTKIQTGQRLPDAGLATLDGKPRSLRNIAQGRRVVLAFWASWCGPCREELRLLGKLSREHPDVAFVAANIEALPAPRVRELAAAWGYQGELVRDAGLAAVVGAPPLPAVVVLDEDGRLR